MSNHKISSDHHVVRYINPSQVIGDRADGSAFVLKKNELGLSVNWLEAFDSVDLCFQLSEVRRLSRLRLARNGRFAKLNVGSTKQYVHNQATIEEISVNLEFVKAPLEKTSEWEADLSHVKMTGIPHRGTVEAAMIGDLIAKCVRLLLFQGKVD